MVVIVNVVVATLPFGVTEAGLKVAVELAGKPLTLNVMASAKPFVVGVTVNGINACCPALTVGRVAGPSTVKPSTVKLTALVVPPPGFGFVTVTFAFPAVATSLAGMAAVSCVALTKVVGSALELEPKPKLTTELAT